VSARCKWRERYPVRRLSTAHRWLLQWDDDGYRRRRRHSTAVALGRRLRRRPLTRRAAARLAFCRGRCESHACFDWPVCRSHLRVWMNANPWEAAAKREPVRAKLQHGKRWAETRGLAPGPWVEVRFPAGDGDPDDESVVIVIMAVADVEKLADRYAFLGHAESSAMLLGLTMSTAALGPGAQLDLLAPRPS
jgi:hypothetical protein